MILKKTILILVQGVVLLQLAACTVVAVPPAADKDAPMEMPASQSLGLGAGDVIRLTVYGEDVLTGQYPINADGFVAIPLIGDMQASGLIKDELQIKITEALVRGGYLTSPQVTVDVVSLRPIYILGEVRNPGKYQWQPDFTAFHAIASAGGYTPRAAKGLILIDRGAGKEREHLNAAEATPILPGDSITVRERIF